MSLNPMCIYPPPLKLKTFIFSIFILTSFLHFQKQSCIYGELTDFFSHLIYVFFLTKFKSFYGILYLLLVLIFI